MEKGIRESIKEYTHNRAQTNDSLSMEERGPVADNESTSDQGGMWVVDELEDALTQSDDLGVARGFGLDEFLRERTQKATAAGNADGGKSRTIGSSKGGAVGTPSPPSGMTDSNSSAASSLGTDQGNGEDPPRRSVREGST